MKRTGKTASCRAAGLRRCVGICAAVLIGVALAAGVSGGLAAGEAGWHLADSADGIVAGVGKAYAAEQGSATDADASSSPSPSPTSNKPETSPSPSGSASRVDELESNVINGSQLPDSSFLYDTSIAALIEADSYFDNQTVQVTGEAVGDSIRSGFDRTYRWITLSSTEVDESEAISVYMSEDFAKLVDGFGKYGRTGTILQVRGTFHLACSEHDGVTDLHAENVSVVKVSESHPDAITWSAFMPGLVLVVLGALGLVGYRIARERLR